MDDTIYGPNGTQFGFEDTRKELEKMLDLLMEEPSRTDRWNKAKINLDTAKKPVVIWEMETNRVVLKSNWDLVVETRQEIDAMGNVSWGLERNQQVKEKVLKECCIALLPERIAESVIDK